jgi:hypothetical protein
MEYFFKVTDKKNRIKYFYISLFIYIFINLLQTISKAKGP